MPVRVVSARQRAARHPRQGAPPAAREPTQAALKVVATEGRPSWGRADARVTIVEFTDYQCPFCRQHFAQTLGPLRRLLADSVRYVVRNYPIPSLHPEAEGAAVAAECAFEQGKFWEYHDRLFEVTAHDAAALRKYARDLKLDVGKFDDCVGSPAAAARVRRDVDDGIALGVQGTPAFFINGRMIEGAVPLAVFALAVQKALMESAK